jgi:hypothetical protein
MIAIRLLLAHFNFRLIAIFGCCFASPILGLADAPAQTLHTATTIHANAQLLKLESQDQLIFQIAERETTVDSSRIVRWGKWAGVCDEQAVWLSDGSWLCGTVQIEHNSLSLVNDWCKPLRLSLDSVRGVVLSPPTTLERWLQLQSQMLAASGEQDIVWLAGGKKLSGIIRWPAADVARPYQSVNIDAAGQMAEVAIDKLQAIVFSPTLLGPLLSNPKATQIGLADGSLLWATELAPETKSVNIALSGGVSLTSLDDPKRFCRAIKFIASDRATTTEIGAQLLSDMQVASYRHVGDSALKWELGVNRDLFGRALHDQQAIYMHGLATHSTSQVAYRWDGSPGRLLAEVVMAAPPIQADERSAGVNCQILLARSGKLESAHSFVLARQANGGTTFSHMVDLDVSNAKLIVLVTDKADYGQYGDQVLWLDARVAVQRP